MKKLSLITLTILLIATIFTIGCDTCINCDDDWDDCYDCGDYYAPPVPTNVRTVTHDGWIEIDWNHSYVSDFSYFKVYFSFSYDGEYSLIGQTTNLYFDDTEALNGETYFYAISAVDIYGNESNLSSTESFDTPRPDGSGVVLWESESYPDDSGMDFSEYQIVRWDDFDCDMYFGYDPGLEAHYLQVANSETDIMHFGRTEYLESVDYAPETGWDPEGWCYVYEGHSYIIWTSDNHFAHIRIIRHYDTHIELDWAYQTDTGNPELRYVRDHRVLFTKDPGKPKQHKESYVVDNTREN